MNHNTSPFRAVTVTPFVRPVNYTALKSKQKPFVFTARLYEAHTTRLGRCFWRLVDSCWQGMSCTSDQLYTKYEFEDKIREQAELAGLPFVPGILRDSLVNIDLPALPKIADTRGYAMAGT